MFISDPGVKKALDPGSGSATLLFKSSAKRVAAVYGSRKYNAKSFDLADAEKNRKLKVRLGTVPVCKYRDLTSTLDPDWIQIQLGQRI
jgi:hypothetical protein